MALPTGSRFQWRVVGVVWAKWKQVTGAAAMSMLGTLAKVAIGVAVAKGVGSMVSRGRTGGGAGGGLFGGAHSP